jgi:uncharacterized protein
MNKKTRLIFLALSLFILFVIGRWATGSFDFIITQFWFASGLFLLIILSLVDQPTFSKDTNIFGNAVAGWMSLLLVPGPERMLIWWLFFSLTTYLILSSFILIWIRKKELKDEHQLIALLSRINREVGKPETLFSAFFLWGGIRQFGLNSSQFNTLLFYWIIFMILNVPAIARAINYTFVRKDTSQNITEGKVLKLIDPKIVEVLLPIEFSDSLVGKGVEILASDKMTIGNGIFIDERIVSGSRVGKVAVTSITEKWKMISDTSKGPCSIKLREEHIDDSKKAISVVDKGTTIDQLVFYLHPNISLQEGEIVYVENEKPEQVFYQIVSALITEELSSEGNAIQCVKVVASQLGLWDNNSKTFSPYLWVPPSGQLIYQGKDIQIGNDNIPKGFSIVGQVPNSKFPVHVYLEDIVTHNTAVIGVTGSGKSYLAFHLIESLLSIGIKVMILDLTREHYQYLHAFNPFPLAQSGDVVKWLTEEGHSNLAIHQFATATSFPKSTFEFTKAAFDILSQEKLQAGKNLPARLCILFEEAHSLIPEWNQVAVPVDKDYVNNTARIILQGRKFGLGSILITQRTANVTKTILNQCNTIFALQSFDQTGLEFLRNYMGEEYSRALSRLPKRQAILVGKSSSSQKPIIFQIDSFEGRWKGPEEEIQQPNAVPFGT